jgi:hypothetical protein
MVGVDQVGTALLGELFEERQPTEPSMSRARSIAPTSARRTLASCSLTVLRGALVG